VATGDIYRIYVAFGQKPGGKVRYTVEVGRKSLGVLVLNAITSQYRHKSDFIKTQYYPIQDWLQAGLDKPSYVDIKSSRTYDLNEIIQRGSHTGQLSLHDVQELARFIKSYRARLEQLKGQR